MSQVINFPNRTLSLKSNTRRMPILWPFVAVLLCPLWIFAAWYLGGRDLVTDTQIGSNYSIDDQGTFTGTCENTDWILRTCDIVMTSGGISRPELIGFFGYAPGDFSSYVVRTSNNRIALLYGQENLLNRWIFLGSFVVLGLSIPVSSIALYRRRNRVATEAAAMKNSELKPVQVTIGSVTRKSVFFGGSSWSYRLPNDKRLFVAAMPRNFKPLILNEGDRQNIVALAVIRDDVRVPVLLDQSLSEISLSEAERQIILDDLSRVSNG